MSTKADDLDLLLSLQDRVLETPPASPSAPPSGMSQSLFIFTFSRLKLTVSHFLLFF